MSFESLCAEAIFGISAPQIEQLRVYRDLLLDWNSRVNLTAITEETEIVHKHFADSVLPMALIPLGARVIDVGTGAGFPGIPLKIMRPDIKLTLLDSLQKRVLFLRAACEALGLEAACIHARAEDAARQPNLRGSFDVATSRAVAACAVLAELTVPFLRVGGLSLMYKGPGIAQELRAANNALRALNASAAVHEFKTLWGDRTILAVTKTAPTPKPYPRKAGTPGKAPL
ncbi:MAG: 16S rRNA (guanine(527)-N(7))-methyltransferase RsmG [Christensenellaceae bacterium]|jgi:16S rRNA (guanine527-N7)-methyltransferase|nr:16S rRNA (guanine(527)-N(7))-methyltransferase RsmG [Christensenellaceae bacterium]